jgi:chemotaxis-related protein WspD
MIGLLDLRADSQLDIVDCWNTIGTHGDRSCSRLQAHIHCRNCPVYAAAACRILERRAGTDEGSENEWHDPRTPTRGATATALVVFRLGLEYFALPAKVIQEIAAECPAHSIPHRKSRLPIGLVNVQGEMMITAALDVLLGADKAASGDTSRGRRHVVVACKGSRFAFLADEVCDILEHTSEETLSVPPTLSSTFTCGLRQQGEKTITLLDPELIMDAVNREIS